MDADRKATAPSLLWLGAALLAPLAIFMLVAGLIWRLNGGHITYSLDDPYIHMALAENILRGHYGINLQEVSSPSSSVLYPVILAAAMATGLRDLAPLALNLAALLATLWIVWTVLCRDVLQDLATRGRWATVITVTMAICLNLIGVTFTGMEHALHALLTALTCFGLFRMLATGAMPRWLPLALALHPLIRFEGAAILVAGAWFLLARGKWLAAMAALGMAALALAAYAALMTRLGLPIFPSSVMVKLAPVSLPYFVLDLLRNHGAAPAIVATIFFAHRLVFVEGLSLRPRSLLVQAALIPVVLHLAAGRFGWLERYEVYLNVWIVLMACQIYRDRLEHLCANVRGGMLVVVALSAFVFIRQGPINLLLTPFAASNIYEQQYQMHRFVADYYRGAVAVNDLGYVSYANDHYVLDLWGLGNETARKLRLGKERNWIGPLVEMQAVKLAILFDTWFPGEIPPGWRKVGTLSLGRLHVASGQKYVTFYATTDAACAGIAERLAEFRPTLPPGVGLTIDGAACAAKP